MKYLSSTVAAGLGAALLAGSAGAQTPDAPPSPPDAEVASSPRSGPLAVPYQRRYVPEANLWELGLFGGMMFPSSSHQLYDPALTSAVQQPFEPSLNHRQRRSQLVRDVRHQVAALTVLRFQPHRHAVERAADAPN